MYLDFKEISKTSFKSVLDWQQVTYREENGKLIGDGFVIDIEKNLYLNPKGSDKGSIINYIANLHGLTVRDAAALIKKEVIDPKPKEEGKIPELELIYPDLFKEQGIPEQLVKELECGYCKQKSIMAGRICFKILDEGVKVGYVGYKPSDQSWFFPKGFKRDFIYNLNRVNGETAIVVPSPLDVIYITAKGKPNAISLMANYPTEAQIKLLAPYQKLILVGMDKNTPSKLLSTHFVKTAIMADFY